MSLRLPATLYLAFSLIISSGVHMVISHQLMFVLELRSRTEPTLHKVEKYWGNWSRLQGPGDCVKSGFFVVSVQCVCVEVLCTSFLLRQGFWRLKDTGSEVLAHCCQEGGAKELCHRGQEA